MLCSRRQVRHIQVSIQLVKCSSCFSIRCKLSRMFAADSCRTAVVTSTCPSRFPWLRHVSLVPGFTHPFTAREGASFAMAMPTGNPIPITVRPTPTHVPSITALLPTFSHSWFMLARRRGSNERASLPEPKESSVLSVPWFGDRYLRSLICGTWIGLPSTS